MAETSNAAAADEQTIAEMIYLVKAVRMGQQGAICLCAFPEFFAAQAMVDRLTAKRKPGIAFGVDEIPLVKGAEDQIAEAIITEYGRRALVLTGEIPLP